MKLILLLFFCAPMIVVGQDRDQSLPRMNDDTLFTTSGYPIIKGQDIKVGVGSMPDGDFKFIRINAGSLFAYHSAYGYQGLANQANSFPRSQSGLIFKIKSIEMRGSKKHGYVYYAKIGFGMKNYEIDVENAIASDEILIPAAFKAKSKNIAAINEKKEISVADEIKKLKELLDAGAITKEEFDIQKKKLLDL